MMASSRPLPRIARDRPYYFKPVPGKTYFWCRCGRSKKQPFCDGSHKGTGFEPLRYEAKEEQPEVLFCGCKHTGTAPFCDGTHNNLDGPSKEDDPDSAANHEISEAVHDREGRFELNGDCCTGRIDRIACTLLGNTEWRTLITAADGAGHQAMYHVWIASGCSPIVSFADADVVLLAASGVGTIEISGRSFALAPESGIYVRPSEVFRVRNSGDDPISLYVTVCPALEPSVLDSMPDDFHLSQPQRVVPFDASKRCRMGVRSFQILVDREVGCRRVTQFIGTVPLSKAQPHRHLYEETLVILRGRGMMWTEDLKTRVQAGDFVFLPARQIHSLQCTDPEGMMLAGVIYPGGNPNINY